MHPVVLYGVLALATPTTVYAKISCMDMNNKPVDWFIVYKLPRLSSSPHPLVKAGLGHFYLDERQPRWTLSDRSLNDTDHAVAYTVHQIHNNVEADDVAYLLYNDEPPNENTSFTNGHTKGDLCFDKKTGFWLVHSLPHFPLPAKMGYAYPHSGLMYGQTFLCVTYPYSQLPLIGGQLLYNYPNVYDSNLPPSLAADNPSLRGVIAGRHVVSPPWNRSVTLQSSGGRQFRSFAKFSNYGEDLYSAWIAPYYRSGLEVESWQNGRAKLPSDCSSHYKVLNVKRLQLGVVGFKETKDHSKWAVTATRTITCIGDINRQEHQKYRAGGTVCFDLPEVWALFNGSVTQLELCKTPPAPRPAILTHPITFDRL